MNFSSSLPLETSRYMALQKNTKVACNKISTNRLSTHIYVGKGDQFDVQVFKWQQQNMTSFANTKYDSEMLIYTSKFCIT